QSLNQIEKAYGPNNSILDNCHVRVAFATNDERTAKRISDALGSTTEMRSMRNYAGHRLAPWLAHVMVSRQETARQLLTPGEVMQLPADEEIILISGGSPIRAKKLRYFQDSNFSSRVTPPPALSDPNHPYGDSPPKRPDDWGQSTRTVDDRLAQPRFDQVSGTDDGGKDRRPELDQDNAEQKDQSPDKPEISTEGDDMSTEAKRAADLAKNTSLVQRAYGVEQAAPKRDLLDF
ncbi:MAG: type IV secretory system conjugative DNA transfer family protein, partial [Alphaproteobacteria bacterium]